MLEGLGAGISRGKRQLLEVARRRSGDSAVPWQLPVVVSAHKVLPSVLELTSSQDLDIILWAVSWSASPGAALW